MSANIPFDIQEEIIKRVVPVKSLIRFRSVSKQWKSLIDCPEFITHHSLNQAHPHHLLLRCTSITYEVNYVSIVDDDDSFPQNKFSHTVSDTLMLNCSHGLVCLHDHAKNLIVVWNPSIRKSVGIPIPYEFNAVGLGVCPKTFYPKIVIIISHSINYEAQVFTLSFGAWRSKSMDMPLPYESLHFSNNMVAIDGVIHWLAVDHTTQNDGSYLHRIITFDLTSEEFGEVDLPDSLVGPTCLSISKLNESLVVLHYYIDDAEKPVCDVWMMLKNGVPSSSFTKLSIVKDKICCIIGFRKNAQPIMHQISGELEVYEPGSGNTNGLGIYGMDFNMVSYKESLLLLSYSDSIIQ